MARKITDGQLRNRARTMRNMVDTVLGILVGQGFVALGVNHIASAAQISKKLIYKYFGSKERLVQAAVAEKDYWVPLHRHAGRLTTDHAVTHGRHLATALLEDLHGSLADDPDMLHHILWEISEHSPEMAAVSAKRELLGHALFRLTAPVFRSTAIDFHATYGMLLGGSYHHHLHDGANGGTTCGVGLGQPGGRQRVLDGVDTVVRLSYRHAGLFRLRNGGSPAAHACRHPSVQRLPTARVRTGSPARRGWPKTLAGMPMAVRRPIPWNGR